MSGKPAKTSHQVLTWIGLGVGLIGIAFTLRTPAHISPAVYWLILLLGIFSVAVGAAIFAKEGRGRSPDIGPPTQEKRLLATECDRFAEAVSAFRWELRRLKPQWRPFANHAARLRRWNEQTEYRYRQEFRPWGLEIFDAAVRLDGIAVSSRVFVEAPSPAQLNELPGLFRDAARSLKR